MKLSFELNSKDMWIFGRHVALKSLRLRLNLLKNTILIGIIVFLYCFFSKFKAFETVLFTTVLVVGYLLLQYKVLKMKLVKAYSGKGAYVGVHTLEILPEGIKEVLPEGFGEDFHSWNDYKNILRHNGYIYIFWRENTGNIIPPTAFKTEADAQACFKELEMRIKGKV